MMKGRKTFIFFLACFTLLGGLSGCAGVKPWERGILADETMNFDPDPLSTGWQLHIREVREGSRGGYSGTGGGCGCR
ncbi:MAG: DUF4266 domain-containing protein [Nitrospiria bacterium]